MLNSFTYTDHDVAIAVREYRDIQENIDDYDGPVTAVFSFGYGEVWSDGDVTGLMRRVVFKVDADGVAS